MKTTIINADSIETDDWFFLAGSLYQVFAVDIQMGMPVEIQFYNPNDEDPAIQIMHIGSDIPLQILN